MQMLFIRPMIWTEALDETVAFYTGNLGFTCAAYNADWGWASLYRDNVGIMVARPNAHTPFEKPLFTGSFYLTVADVDALWEELRDKARICYPIEDFEYGMREFALYDNNGYLLQFGQEIAP